MQSVQYDGDQRSQVNYMAQTIDSWDVLLGVWYTRWTQVQSKPELCRDLIRNHDFSWFGPCRREVEIWKKKMRFDKKCTSFCSLGTWKCQEHDCWCFGLCEHSTKRPITLCSRGALKWPFIFFEACARGSIYIYTHTYKISFLIIPEPFRGCVA